MSLDEHLTRYLRRLVGKRRILHRDTLLEARGMQVDAIGGSIDTCREIVSDKIEDWDSLEASFERAKHRMLREAAKASEDQQVRDAFQLRDNEKFCPHRFSRICGQIREHDAIRDDMAAHLMHLVA